MLCQHFLGRIERRRSNQKLSKVCGYRKRILQHLQLHLLGMPRMLIPCRGAGKECSPISKVRHRPAEVLTTGLLYICQPKWARYTVFVAAYLGFVQLLLRLQARHRARIT